MSDCFGAPMLPSVAGWVVAAPAVAQQEAAMNDQPGDPLTLVGAAAVELHELFQSLIRAGFSRKEALYLTGQYLTTSLAAGKPGEDTP